jgi:hypothetical protein
MVLRSPPRWERPRDKDSLLRRVDEFTDAIGPPVRPLHGRLRSPTPPAREDFRPAVHSIRRSDLTIPPRALAASWKADRPFLAEPAPRLMLHAPKNPWRTSSTTPTGFRQRASLLQPGALRGGARAARAVTPRRRRSDALPTVACLARTARATRRPRACPVGPRLNPGSSPLRRRSAKPSSGDL